MTARSLFALPPLWREGRLGLELAALLRNPVVRGEGIPDAGGQPVMLIPGFLAGDDSLAVMTRWLRRTGHRTRKAGMRSNVNCSEVAVERLEERLEVMVETHGEKVALIGLPGVHRLRRRPESSRSARPSSTRSPSIPSSSRPPSR